MIVNIASHLNLNLVIELIVSSGTTPCKQNALNESIKTVSKNKIRIKYWTNRFM